MACSGQYSRSILGASDEIKDIYCEPCKKAGHVAIAEGYCKNCPEYLCGPCFKSHRRHKALENHVLLGKDSMPITTDSSKRVVDVCEKKCPFHPNKVIELFCETCYKLACTICVATDHRQCEDVKHIPDIVKDLEHDKEMQKEMQKLEGYIEFTADILSEHEENLKVKITSNNEMITLAKQEQKRHRNELNSFFDQLEKKMDEKITALEKKNRGILKAASDKLDNIKTELDQIKNDVEAKQTGQKCERFISITQGKQKMNTFHDKFNKMEEELRIQCYSLFPSEQIQAMMRATTEICRIATASLESEIDIKTMTDPKELHILRFTILHERYCVALDYTSERIIVIDTKNKCISSEKTIEAENIWSLTSVSEDQVAVQVSLLGQKEQIQFFTVSASGVIKKTKKLLNVTQYFDIFHSEGYIYGLGPCIIDQLNITGKITKTIQIDKKYFDLKGIALSPDGQTIYVTDNLNHKVISFTLDGKVNAIYKDDNLREPDSIAVDKYGYLHVGSQTSVHMLTPDLNKVHVTDGYCYVTVTYSSTENKLYIISGDKISLYSLDYK